MKRMMQWAALALTVLLLQGHSVPQLTSQMAAFEKSPVSTVSASAFFITYDWYYDEDYLNPVGRNSSISTEVNRLRWTYPSYIFDSAPGIGLHPYEYGYNPIFLPVTIYSDK